jgi:hypothetical protein
MLVIWAHIALRALQWSAVEVQLETSSTAMLVNQSSSIDVDAAKIVVSGRPASLLSH